jgi:Fe2+ transport system protein FeoA
MILSNAPVGALFQVRGVRIGREVGKRLSDMGFTEGRGGAVVRRGLLGGPMQVRILDYDILIRRTEAAGIEIEIGSSGEWTAFGKDGRRRGTA